MDPEIQALFDKIHETIEKQVQLGLDRIKAINSLKKFLHAQQSWTPEELKAWQDKQDGGAGATY